MGNKNETLSPDLCYGASRPCAYVPAILRAIHARDASRTDVCGQSYMVLDAIVHLAYSGMGLPLRRQAGRTLQCECFWSVNLGNGS